MQILVHLPEDIYRDAGIVQQGVNVSILKTLRVLF